MNALPAEPVLVDLASHPGALLDQAASLLHENFAHPFGWETLEAARREVDLILREGFARGLVAGGILLGWVGGLPEYHGRVWELHPLVVRAGHRRRSLGRRLVEEFEAEARARGGLTATLGTDDDRGITSLADVDLYADIPGHVAGLRDLGQQHPFLFYRKLGYVVTGVMPDANGPGRPDIYMSKTLREAGSSRS